jgi:hypothetical protein
VCTICKSGLASYDFNLNDETHKICTICNDRIKDLFERFSNTQDYKLSSELGEILSAFPVTKSTKMHVISVDQQGKQIGEGEWIDVPPPDIFKTEGISKLDGYVSKLLSSTAHHAGIIIATLNGKCAIGLSKREQVDISLGIDWRSEQEKEVQIREFFRQLHISPTHDYLAGNGNVPNATRSLRYPLGDEPKFIIEVCSNVLIQVYNLSETDGLQYSFTER